MKELKTEIAVKETDLQRAHKVILMLLFFKACIVHVVFDAFVTSLSLSDSQERGAGHLKKKKDVCMEYET